MKIAREIVEEFGVVFENGHATAPKGVDLGEENGKQLRKI